MLRRVVIGYQTCIAITQRTRFILPELTGLSADTQALRMRSVRSLYDPTYVAGVDLQFGQFAVQSLRSSCCSELAIIADQYNLLQRQLRHPGCIRASQSAEIFEREGADQAAGSLTAPARQLRRVRDVQPGSTAMPRRCGLERQLRTERGWSSRATLSNRWWHVRRAHQSRHERSRYVRRGAGDGVRYCVRISGPLP